MNQETTKQELQQDQSQEPDVCGEGLDDAAAVNDRQPEEAEAAETAIDTEEGCRAGAEEEATEQQSDMQSDEEKKSFFNKKKKKDKKDEMIDDLTDRVKRVMAEFENFRKRTEREKTQMYEIVESDVIEKMLPVLDNFERGIQSISEEELNTPVGEGMTMIYRQMLGVFEQIGVQAIEAVGTEFDPNLHNAVLHVEDEEAGENVVVEELQKGYRYHDTVIRHSMVKVAN